MDFYQKKKIFVSNRVLILLVFEWKCRILWNLPDFTWNPLDFIASILDLVLLPTIPCRQTYCKFQPHIYGTFVSFFLHDLILQFTGIMSETSKYSYFEEKILEYVDNCKDKYGYDMMVDLPWNLPCISHWTLYPEIYPEIRYTWNLPDFIYGFQGKFTLEFTLTSSHFLSNQF